MNSLYNKIYENLLKHRNEECAEQMSAYMKDNFKFLGVQTPIRRSVTKPIFDNHAEYIDWVFVKEAWASDYRELQYAANDYLGSMKKLLTPKDLVTLKRLIETKSWWDTVDELAKTIGTLMLKNSALNPRMLEWSKDDCMWVRRIAILHQLLRKKQTNVELFEQIIINNFHSDEFFINKAIGWALREYSKTNKLWVQNFIDTHKDALSALSIKEASKYL